MTATIHLAVLVDSSPLKTQIPDHLYYNKCFSPVLGVSNMLTHRDDKYKNFLQISEQRDVQDLGCLRSRTTSGICDTSLESQSEPVARSEVCHQTSPRAERWRIQRDKGLRSPEDGLRSPEDALHGCQISSSLSPLPLFPSRKLDDSDQRDPLLGSTIPAAVAADTAAAGTTAPRPASRAASGAPVRTSAGATLAVPAVALESPPITAASGDAAATLVVSTATDRKRTFDALHVTRPSLQAFLDDRKTSLPIWKRKDSANSRKDSVATTTSKERQLGSFAEESGRGRSSMRPATSLDAISQHRVCHRGGRDFPSRSATISTMYPSDPPQPGLSGSTHRPHTLDNLDPAARNNILKPFPNASSESDLSRYRARLPGRDRHSPSLSNLTAEGIRHKFSFQDPTPPRVSSQTPRATRRSTKLLTSARW
ncbi:uncharacterized protein [Procambarus clarkii]|uniref:uncharacterized protein n=1 Tax=Procambarus clarkii TaxID=6728 RepID=UPI0037447DA0